MKNVQIPYDLFVALVEYHLGYDDEYEDEIRQGLEQTRLRREHRSHRILRLWVSTCKPKQAEGSPESRKAFWGEEEQRNE